MMKGFLNRQQREIGMKDVMIAVIAALIIIGIVVSLVAFILLITYGFGWIVGWTLHLFIGPDMIFGVTFEQFVGLVFVCGGILTGSTNTEAATKTKEAFNTVKRRF